MRKCRKCGIFLTEKNWIKSCREQHNYLCKECLTKFRKEYYQKNREKIIRKVRDWTIKNRKKSRDYHRKWKKNHPNYTTEWQRKLKKKFVDLLGGKCQRCGYDKCREALEFHHKDKKEKERHSGEFRKKGFKEKILNRKIALLCANCHREEHYERATLQQSYN